MKIGLICSHGGHLTEMVEMQAAFAGHSVFYVTYDSERAETLARHEQVYQLQNIGVSPWRLLRATWIASRIFHRERPDMLVSTGSEIALPFFYLAWLLGIKTIFIESVCRLSTPSQTGRLVYPIATEFFVQWPALAPVYGPKAQFAGGLL
ncbi:MAG: PssD/Cps14F family polysaccharide biosynthesis glycosyltransferase [Chloroflexota bacterium]